MKKTKIINFSCTSLVDIEIWVSNNEILSEICDNFLDKFENCFTIYKLNEIWRIVNEFYDHVVVYIISISDGLVLMFFNIKIKFRLSLIMLEFFLYLLGLVTSCLKVMTNQSEITLLTSFYNKSSVSHNLQRCVGAFTWIKTIFVEIINIHYLG